MIPFVISQVHLNLVYLEKNKSLVKGDYLIDDDHRHGQTEFEGEHIHFGKNKNFQTWSQVVEYLMSK